MVLPYRLSITALLAAIPQSKAEFDFFEQFSISDCNNLFEVRPGWQLDVLDYRTR